MNASFGAALTAAGDVNGDGFGDLLVAAPRFDTASGDEGRVELFLGADAGLSAASAWTSDGVNPGDRHGAAVALAGDVNADGFSDVIVGAPGYDGGDTDEGRAVVFYGGPSGLAAAPAWTLEGGQPGAQLGAAVAGIGDVDGDGFSDIAVAAPRYDAAVADGGRVLVFTGGPAGIATEPTWVLDGDHAGELFGTAIAAGDVDADGHDDLLVGAPGYGDGQPGEGRVRLFPSPGGVLASEPSWSTESDHVDAAFGAAVTVVGDANGDGYADVVVGAPLLDNGSLDEGRAYLYLGGAGGLAASPAWTHEPNVTDSRFGAALAGAGDVNSDGFADLVVGAPGHSAGRAQVFPGRASGFGAAIWSLQGDLVGAQYGAAVASAGDVNGDGFADVAVGAPSGAHGEGGEGWARVYTSNGAMLPAVPSWVAEGNQAEALFGLAPTSAGDVNGDGYDDIAVGAHFYSGGQEAEGRVVVYHGGAGGPGTTPSWAIESNQAHAYLGATAPAGDVNGDGYDDLLVGAFGYDGDLYDEGRVFLYLGSSTGLANSPSWYVGTDQTPELGWDLGLLRQFSGMGDLDGDGYDDVVIAESQYRNGDPSTGRARVFRGGPSGLSPTPSQVLRSPWGDGFAAVVSGAGDVNGDGFDDLVVGEPYAGQHGRVHVYHGGVSGLEERPQWQATATEQYDYFASAATTAGDVNGDGFDDLIIGASNNMGGRARLFLGGPAGLATSPAWTYAAAGYFGDRATGAGDVDGDGYGDVVVGARGTNMAYVFRGSPTGLEAAPAWVEAGPSQSNFGNTVAGAGDVNGDGFADVLVGAQYYDNGETDEGAAFLYLGGTATGGTSGRGLRPQARRAGSAIPIARGGMADSSTFDLVVRASTPWGRMRTRLEIEIEPLGTPFDGVGTQLTDWLDTGTSGVDHVAAVSGLAAGTSYHWRARLLYDPVRGRPVARSRWVWGGTSGHPVGRHVRAHAPDSDGDGYHDVVDCAPGDPTHHPGVPEIPDDGIDQNCSGSDQVACWLDLDLDGFGGVRSVLAADGDCADPGESVVSTDCVDYEVAIHPGAVDHPGNGVDEDCSGSDSARCLVDADGDGYHTGEEIISSDADCTDPGEVAPNAPWGDCDDQSASTYPGAPEVIGDGIDQDCSGNDSVSCFYDFDDDEHGLGEAHVDIDGDCGYRQAPVAGDCDDRAPSVYPGASEVVGDGIDQDCSGTDSVACHVDADGDGVGGSELVVATDGDCVGPGEAPEGGDCAPDDSTIYPGASEQCDAVDQDCDGDLADGFSDLDDDGQPDCVDLDVDGDGLDGEIEEELGLDPSSPDSDGDTISDDEEVGDPDAPYDTDEDDVIDALDDDADGDRISDADEAGDADLDTAAVDTDGDTTPDYRDRDSDDDGLDDRDEAGDDDLDTPPIDSDGDGVPDFRDPDPDEDDPGVEDPQPQGCGCRSSSDGTPVTMALVCLLALRRRRRTGGA